MQQDIPVQEDRLQALHDTWPRLTIEQRRESFFELNRPEAEELFLRLSSSDQYELISELSWPEKRSWLRLLAPDDTADLIQEAPSDEREGLLALLDDVTRKEVIALLAYAEDK